MVIIKVIDLTGQKFNKLTVLERDLTKTGRAYWICKCDCGNLTSVSGTHLRRGTIKSCGCLTKEVASKTHLKDLTGQTFGKLTVLKRDNKDYQNNEAYWVCQCDCGNITVVSGILLRNEHTKSCGCLQKEIASKTHLKDLTAQRFGQLMVLKRDFKIEKEREKLNKKKRVYWLCQCDCGKVVSLSSNDLTHNQVQNCGCKRLTSKGEQKIEQLLKNKGYTYQKEYSFQDLQGDNRLLRFDFAVFKNKELLFLIEYQGKQHYFPIDYFGGEIYLKRQKRYDEYKRQYCLKNKINLIEIPYWDFDKINEKYLEEKFMLVCQFDRNDQCFEDCPQCSRYKVHYCDSCGGEFDRDDLVDGLCPECCEEYFYCEDCGREIFEDEYYEYDGRCEDCYKSFDE